jgi:hypothetical protein
MDPIIMKNLVINSRSDLREAFSHSIGNMKMKIAISTLVILTLSANLFASDVVILECGEYNFTPGINIRAVSTSLKIMPPYLALGSSSAVAIAKLVDTGFTFQHSDIGGAPFFQNDSTVHTYTMIRN